MSFGLIPALTSSRSDLNEALKEGGRSGRASSGRRTRGALITAEIALALVVLIGAGLMVRSFARLQSVEPGFETSDLTTMFIWLSDPKYTRGQPRIAFLRDFVARLETTPGIRGVAVGNDLPITGTDTKTNPSIEGRTLDPPNDQLQMGVHVINANYFQAMGIPLLKGRAFTLQDNDQTNPVAIINETMANRLWPNEDPIGKRIRLGGEDLKEIVGIVGDVRYDGLHEPAGLHCYTPHLQEPWPYMTVAVRSNLDTAAATSLVRRELDALDPNQPVSRAKRMDELIDESLASRKLSTLLFGLFAVAGLVLTVVGIYGVTAYSVTQQTHEIGIRMALGANQSDVLKMVIGHGMRLAAIGISVGLTASFGLTHLLEALLFDVSTTDGLTFIVTVVVVMLVTLLACYLPARRAARVDPMEALRYE